GAAVGIVADDRLVYAKGFGVRRKGGGEPVDAKTVFQIGSTTKAFLATALAIAVDRGKLKWNDRVIDRDPDFVLRDPWVTREFRVYDLLAQRSGLPPYANDLLAFLGFDADRLMHSLRFVEPRTSFRSTFTYTNITHLFAGRIAAQALGASDWPALARRELLDPLDMHETSFSADAIENAPDHAAGHHWTRDGSVEIPFNPLFPYPLGPAGDLNSTLEDCARWLRLQLGDGLFEGRRLVSEKNLAVTRTPKVAISEHVLYAMGWIIDATANGRVVWHNGGTGGFGALIGFAPAQHVGFVVLSNEENKGFPDGVGLWFFDRLLGNREIDYVQKALDRVTASAAEGSVVYERPAAAHPPPDLGVLAGDYTSEVMGRATLAAADGGLVLTLGETGAQLRLDPFDGAVFTVRLVPQGRFAAAAAGQADMPAGFADFGADGRGRLTRLRITVENQPYLWLKRSAPPPH
ncbi:MAG TPA: serine hydrolase domain-containing protein, partial [Stellaceae bacterium]|nr:serine hydrolase domain-containing protein [Stellaceae bacterium]